MSLPGVTASKVVVERDRVQIIRGASFEVPKGSCAGLVGRSGSGKTTLLMALAGMLPLSGGGLSVLRRSVATTPLPALGVHFLSQSPLVLDHLTVRQNLDLPTRFRSIDVNIAQIDYIAECLGLRPLLERSARLISGGERQRLAIGQAMRSPAPVLLLDEPIKAALEPELRHQVRQALVRHMRDYEKTVIFVSHDVDDISALADHVLMLGRDGLIASCGIEQFFTAPPDLEIARDMDLGVIFDVAGSEQGNILLSDGVSTVGIEPPVADMRPGTWIVPHKALAVVSGSGWRLTGLRPALTGQRVTFQGPGGTSIVFLAKEPHPILIAGQHYDLEISAGEFMHYEHSDS